LKEGKEEGKVVCNSQKRFIFEIKIDSLIKINMKIRKKKKDKKLLCEGFEFVWKINK
jgi:hypothetical protein